MTYEYRDDFVPMPDGKLKPVTEFCNRMGKEGWELCGVVPSMMIPEILTGAGQQAVAGAAVMLKRLALT
jgi:hypothetical protein